MISLDDGFRQFRSTEAWDGPVHAVRDVHPMEGADAAPLAFGYEPAGIITVVLKSRVLAECAPFAYYDRASEQHQIGFEVIKHLADFPFHCRQIVYHRV